MLDIFLRSQGYICFIFAPLEDEGACFIFAPLEDEGACYIFAPLEDEGACYIFAPLEDEGACYIFAPLSSIEDEGIFTYVVLPPHQWSRGIHFCPRRH